MEDAKQLLRDAEAARAKLRVGLIGYEEARAVVAKYAEVYNKVAKEKAKEFGVPFRKFSITAFMR